MKKTKQKLTAAQIRPIASVKLPTITGGMKEPGKLEFPN